VLFAPSFVLTMEADSYVDVPKDLLKEIEKLEQLFTIDTAKLKRITDHFVDELEKGQHSVCLDIGMSWANNYRLKRGRGLYREFPCPRPPAQTDSRSP